MVYFLLFLLAIINTALFFHAASKDAENKKLKEENKLLSKKLKEQEEYKEIIKDSLELNVKDEEPPQAEEVVEKESPSEEKEPIISIEEQEGLPEKKSGDLNEEKLKIYDLMENTSKNLLITGKAGTGKSYLLKYFKNKTHKKVLFAVPTGIAALNISAVTLHSAFGFNNLMDDHEIALSNSKKSLFKTIDTIVIDEISMVRADVFNQIDKILKYCNSNFLPFGGKQVILFGDLFQLPPVAKSQEALFLTKKYGGVFFFNSPAYENGRFQFREIQTIFRQTDKVFIDILNNIREGKILEEDIKTLNSRYTTDIPKRIARIVPKKDKANKINEDNLNKLDSKEYEYEAQILLGDEKLKESDFPCDFNLRLRVGALVMMITNDQEGRRWVNGTLGIVSKLSDNSITVTIDGIEYEISPVSFNKYKCIYNEEKKKLEYVVEHSVSQYPLILSYAITIHKSQGMTYQQIACDLDNCFAPGQAYVALSRCANFDKLYLIRKVVPSSIIINNTVVNFYNEQLKNTNNN